MISNYLLLHEEIIKKQLMTEINKLKSKSYVLWFFILSLYLIVFQELIASQLAVIGFNVFLSKLFLILKELIVITIGVYVWYKYKKEPEIKIFFIFFLVTILYLFVSPIPFSSAIQDYRIYPLLISSYFIGYYFGRNDNYFSYFYKHILIIFVFVISFGFIEHFLFPETMFREYFPVMKIATDIKGFSDNEFYLEGLSGNIITTDAGKRMVGPFGEPLYMAYFLIILINFLFASWFYSEKKQSKKVLLFTILLGIGCILLGQVRAIWIGFIFSLFYLFLNKKYYKYLLLFLIVLSFFVILKSDLVVITIISALDWNTGSAIGHALAYIDGIPKILAHPLGQGIGVAGFFAVRSQELDMNQVFGVENAYLNLAIEMGIFNALFIIGVSLYIISNGKKILLNNFVKLEYYEKVLLLGSVLLNVQFMIAGFLAPHIMTARIVIPFWFFNGTSIYIIKKTKIIYFP